MVGELGVLKIGQLGMGEMGDGCVDAFDGYDKRTLQALHRTL